MTGYETPAALEMAVKEAAKASPLGTKPRDRWVLPPQAALPRLRGRQRLVYFRTRELGILRRQRSCSIRRSRAFGERIHRLGRHPLADGRMGVPAVAAALDGPGRIVPGGAPHGEAPPAAHPVLRGREERLGHGAAMAAARAAARGLCSAV
jgi:hypothetical protein